MTTARDDHGVLAGQLGEAERVYRNAVRLDPTSSEALFSLGYCLELRNAPDSAVQFYRHAMQVNGVPVELMARYDRVYASSGLPGVCAAWLDQFKTNNGIPRFMVAFLRPAPRLNFESTPVTLLFRKWSVFRQASRAIEPYFVQHGGSMLVSMPAPGLRDPRG